MSEYRIPVGLEMAVLLPANLEWFLPLVQHIIGRSQCGINLRCIWLLGLWCALLSWSVVQLQLFESWSDVHITIKECCQSSSEWQCGATDGRDSWSPAGVTLLLSWLAIINSEKQGGEGGASDQVFVLLPSEVECVTSVQPYSWLTEPHYLPSSDWFQRQAGHRQSFQTNHWSACYKERRIGQA